MSVGLVAIGWVPGGATDVVTKTAISTLPQPALATRTTYICRDAPETTIAFSIMIAPAAKITKALTVGTYCNDIGKKLCCNRKKKMALASSLR